MGSASREAVAPEGIKNRQARLAGNGVSLPRGATPQTTVSRLARREQPRWSNTALQSSKRTCHSLQTAPCLGSSGLVWVN